MAETLAEDQNSRDTKNETLESIVLTHIPTSERLFIDQASLGTTFGSGPDTCSDAQIVDTPSAQMILTPEFRDLELGSNRMYRFVSNAVTSDDSGFTAKRQSVIDTYGAQPNMGEISYCGGSQYLFLAANIQSPQYEEEVFASLSVAVSSTSPQTFMEDASEIAIQLFTN